MTDKRPTFPRPPWWQARKNELLEAIGKRRYLFVMDEETLNELAFSYLSLSNAPLALHRVSANGAPEVLRKLHDLGIGFLLRSHAEGEWLARSVPNLSSEDVSFAPGYRVARSEKDRLPGILGPSESGEWARAARVSLEDGNPSKWAEDLRAFIRRQAKIRDLLVELNLPIPIGHAERETLITELDDVLFDFREEFPELRLGLVPNALLVAEAGLLLCRVRKTDNANGRPTAILDMLLGTFLAPRSYSGHPVIRLTGQDSNSETAFLTTLYGSRDSRRLYPLEARLPPPATGDILAVFHAGAFGDRPFNAARREAVFFLKARAVCTLC